MIKFKVKKIDIRTVQDGSRNRWNSRVHIFEDNNPAHKPVVELFNGERWNKPQRDYKIQVMPAVIKAMGLVCPKVTWSQKAGCQCGCSPGFIVKGGIPKDVFVSVERIEDEPELSFDGKPIYTPKVA
jgi:hypothetical protein